MKQTFVFCFSGILDIGQVDDERQIDRQKKIISRFTGKLARIIKDAGSKFGDYSISPKIKQILLY